MFSFTIYDSCRMLHFSHFIFFGLFLIGALSGNAQADTVRMFGVMCDENTKQRLVGYSIRTLKNGAVYSTQISGKVSDYVITMPLGFVYDVEFSLIGYLGKIIRVDARNIPEKYRASTFELEVNGTLFSEREGFNTKILDEPMAKAAFKVKSGSIEFDESYYKERQKIVNDDFERLDDLQKNAVLRQKEFEAHIRAGDLHMVTSSFEAAVFSYSEALKIFPLDVDAQSKYNLAVLKVAELLEKSWIQKQYLILMAKGDSLMNAEILIDAQRAYLEAKRMNETNEVKEKLYLVDQALKQLEKRNEYAALVSSGDNNFGEGNFEASIKDYTDALALFPEESYPASQIEKARKALENPRRLIVETMPFDISEMKVDTADIQPIQKVVFVVNPVSKNRAGIERKEYRLGNKMITEYIIQKGRYQESYRMVEAKNATYYFRNNTSMTQSLWNQAIASFEE